MTTVTQADYAKLKGWNKSTVTRAKQAGRLVMVSGLVDVEATDARLAETGGGREDVAERHAAERAAALKVGAGETASTAPSNPQQDDRVGNSYQAARAVKEKYAALAAKLDYERATGNLIPKEDVDAALKALGASVRARLDVLADQLAPVVAPVADLDEVHAVLAEHFRAVLAGIADDLHRQEESAS